ncbi:5-dehydro-4-deoxy-D-glucuronate isomerase [Sagittula stellata]|uniref:4-deoxy-L-threo-5-hexosulose-uronate ketol-isomerase n=2 Tax=Sagittula TaxID=58842 RepID=A3K120_SAGS3|nr:5-dehydro-4-deoxy-D-glucuronate isomerase [Sagittula stellata]EBA09485.1 5-keto-4-deoxyuronate isomerase [Sagittula stellata E-37]
MTTNAETRYAIDPATAKGLDTQGLRDHFHVGGLFAEGEIKLVYSHYDRLILGSAVPGATALVLDQTPETGTATILERREMGILNIGETGTVEVGGESHTVGKGEVLYVGMGSGAVTFNAPGRYYVLSAPAHRACPTKLVTFEMARHVELGAQETSNERTIHQFVHPEVVESCQLVMGYTQFKRGSIWNTMPCHLHDRRMEAYLYFDIPEGQRVFHFMGKPEETRHMVIANEEAIISPPWSIHAGAGTSAYTFCWAMAGDNVDFTDMDMVAMEDLR